ncbi:MAG: hypothetical protein BMS9Abin37_1389 [Acidobacteriota bacterium]|nr:MAG: hypothetical protein BMS9Abin37_1389 [Acidobacteriota bacterium]
MCSWLGIRGARTRARLGVLALVALPFVGGRRSAAQTTETPLRAGELHGTIVIDGVLDEPAWLDAPAISNLVMIDPREGDEPTGKTIVRVLGSPKLLVFGVVCEDPDPSGIVSFTKERDGELRSEDHIKIVLDPFRDGRTGYVFMVNPGGARYDALVTNRGESENSNWDGIWYAATSRSDEGWSLELRIPIQTLGFEGGRKDWGFNIERRIQRLLETDRWASPRRDWKVTQTSRAGSLTGLPDFDLGLGLGVRPAVTGGYNRGLTSTDPDIEPSLDIQQRLGANLLSSLTVNTDFAETEVDTRQTNLTRFPLFFPEKRTFFLEGADIFDFGLGLRSDLVPFFSRRIGLVAGQEVPIRVGGKMNGRVSGTNVGALAIHTGNLAELVPETTMGVVRVSRNLFAESTFGAIGTFGDPRGRTGAYTAGADFTYQTSRFRGDKNFLIGVWGLVTGRDDLHGDNRAWGAKIDYPNDRWDVSLTLRKLGEAFDPSLGFVPRNSYRYYRLGATYRPRPDTPWIRQLVFRTFPQVFTDLEGRWESYRVLVSPLDMNLESGDGFGIRLTPTGERLDEPFEIADGVIIPPGSYEWLRYSVRWRFAAKRKLSGRVNWAFGSFYDGTLNELAIEGSWTPSPLVTLQVSLERNVGDIPWGEFNQSLIGTRVRLNISPDLQLNSFIQYDNISNSIGSNTRLRWTFRPEGDLFVIYNNNVNRFGDRWRREADGLIVKLQYMFRR